MSDYLPVWIVFGGGVLFAAFGVGFRCGFGFGLREGARRCVELARERVAEMKR